MFTVSVVDRGTAGEASQVDRGTAGEAAEEVAVQAPPPVPALSCAIVCHWLTVYPDLVLDPPPACHLVTT